MSRAGLLCRGHFYPGITRSDPSRSRRVFTKRFFKAVRMSSILPDAPLLLVLFSGWSGERYDMEKRHPGDILYYLGQLYSPDGITFHPGESSNTRGYFMKRQRDKLRPCGDVTCGDGTCTGSE